MGQDGVGKWWGLSTSMQLLCRLEINGNTTAWGFFLNPCFYLAASSAGSDTSGFSRRQNHSLIESCMGSQWFRLLLQLVVLSQCPLNSTEIFLLTSKNIYLAFFCQPLSAIKAILCTNAWWTQFLGWCFSSITACLVGLVMIIAVKVVSFALLWACQWLPDLGWFKESELCLS